MTRMVTWRRRSVLIGLITMTSPSPGTQAVLVAGSLQRRDHGHHGPGPGCPCQDPGLQLHAVQVGEEEEEHGGPLVSREQQKNRWLDKCVEELKANDKWVLPALKQIKEICSLYQEQPNQVRVLILILPILLILILHILLFLNIFLTPILPHPSAGSPRSASPRRGLQERSHQQAAAESRTRHPHC